MPKASKLLSIRRRRRVLLVWRANKPAAQLPGGKRRKGESAKKALKREGREELGKKAKMKRVRFWKHLNGKEDTIYLGGVAGKIKPGGEIIRARYRVPKNVHLTPTTRKVCEDAVRAGLLSATAI